MKKKYIVSFLILFYFFTVSYGGEIFSKDFENLNKNFTLDLSEKEKQIKKIQEYIVGVLLPLSGKYKSFGVRAKKGLEFGLIAFALKYPQINIKLIFQDTKGNKKFIENAMDNLIAGGASVIIGPILTANTAAIYAEKNKIPIILLSQKKNITNIGDYVFRNFLTSEMQIKTMLDYAVDNLKIKNFAVFYPKENYGESFLSVFCWETLKRGGEVVLKESYNPSYTDFSPYIKKLFTKKSKKDYVIIEEDEDLGEENIIDYLDTKADRKEMKAIYALIKEDEVVDKKKSGNEVVLLDFDAIFIPDSIDNAGLIIPQLNYYDIDNVYILGTNLWNSNTIIEMAGAYAKKAIFADAFFVDASDKTKNFVKKFKKIFSLEPKFIESISYDCLGILYQIFSSENLFLTKSDIKEAILKVKHYDGMTGSTTFLENGDVDKELSLLKIKRKKIVLIK